MKEIQEWARANGFSVAIDAYSTPRQLAREAKQEKESKKQTKLEAQKQTINTEPKKMAQNEESSEDEATTDDQQKKYEELI